MLHHSHNRRWFCYSWNWLVGSSEKSASTPKFVSPGIQLNPHYLKNLAIKTPFDFVSFRNFFLYRVHIQRHFWQFFAKQSVSNLVSGLLSKLESDRLVFSFCRVRSDKPSPILGHKCWAVKKSDGSRYIVAAGGMNTAYKVAGKHRLNNFLF